MAEREEPKSDDRPARDGKPRGERAGNRGTGRRNLKDLGLTEERIELGSTTPMPDEMLPSSIAAPSLAAHVIMENVGKGCRCSGSRTRSSAMVSRSIVARSRAGRSSWATRSVQPL